jgi:hypothetical protein
LTSIFLRFLKYDWVGTKGSRSHKTPSLKLLLTAPKKKISSTKWWVFIGVLQSIYGGGGKKEGQGGRIKEKGLGRREL